MKKVKVIIVEGTDNTGKDTLIQEIASKFSVVKTYHCQKPVNKDPIFAALEQKNGFEQIVENIQLDIENNLVDDFAIILNRAWYGEFVYGCMYRGNGEEYVRLMIKFLEDKLKQITDEIYYITLVSSNPELNVKNDDGLSIRNDKDSIIKEAQRFITMYDESSLVDKLLVLVNKEGTSEFRPKEEIFNEVMNFLGMTIDVEL